MTISSGLNGLDGDVKGFRLKGFIFSQFSHFVGPSYPFKSGGGGGTLNSKYPFYYFTD